MRSIRYSSHFKIINIISSNKFLLSKSIKTLFLLIKVILYMNYKNNIVILIILSLVFHYEISFVVILEDFEKKIMSLHFYKALFSILAIFSICTFQELLLLDKIVK